MEVLNLRDLQAYGIIFILYGLALVIGLSSLISQILVIIGMSIAALKLGAWFNKTFSKPFINGDQG